MQIDVQSIFMVPFAYKFDFGFIDQKSFRQEPWKSFLEDRVFGRFVHNVEDRLSRLEWQHVPIKAH